MWMVTRNDFLELKEHSGLSYFWWWIPSAMEFFSRMRLTIGLDQCSNLCGIWLCVWFVNFFVFHNHDNLPLGRYWFSSPSTKELHATALDLNRWILKCTTRFNCIKAKSNVQQYCALIRYSPACFNYVCTYDTFYHEKSTIIEQSWRTFFECIFSRIRRTRRRRRRVCFTLHA